MSSLPSLLKSVVAIPDPVQAPAAGIVSRSRPEPARAVVQKHPEHAGVVRVGRDVGGYGHVGVVVAVEVANGQATRSLLRRQMDRCLEPVVVGQRQPDRVLIIRIVVGINVRHIEAGRPRRQGHVLHLAAVAPVDAQRERVRHARIGDRPGQTRALAFVDRRRDGHVGQRPVEVDVQNQGRVAIMVATPDEEVDRLAAGHRACHVERTAIGCLPKPRRTVTHPDLHRS
jgi:hypothetical protein